MAEHSPTPWRVVTHDDSDECDIYSAQGTPVCTMSHCPDNPEADAALIVEAVNERDRLRDLVRRLAEYIHHSCYYCDGPWEIDIKCSCKSDNYHGNADALIREAREALGEEVPQ